MNLLIDYPIIFNAILYAAALYFVFKRTKRVDLSVFLLLVYFLFAISSVLLYYDLFGYYRLEIFPFIYLFSTLLIAFYPIFKFDSRNIYRCVEPNKILFYVTSMFFITVIIANAVLISPYIIKNISLSLTDPLVFRDLYEEKTFIQASQRDSPYRNLFSGFAGVSAEIVLLFFFYYISRNNRNLILTWGLGVASFLPTFTSMVTGNRGKLVTTLLSICFLYFLFKNVMSPSIKRKTKILIIIFISLILTILLSITLARFAKHQKIDDSAIYSIVKYTGQPMLNFNMYALSEDVRQNGDNSFPFFRMLLGLEYSRSIQERQFTWGFKMKNIQGAFYTFIGDLVFDFGPYIAFILITFSAYYVRGATKFRKQYRFHQFIILFIWMSICIQGATYFTYKTIGGNYIIIYMFMIYLLFRTGCIHKKEKT